MLFSYAKVHSIDFALLNSISISLSAFQINKPEHIYSNIFIEIAFPPAPHSTLRRKRWLFWQYILALDGVPSTFILSSSWALECSLNSAYL